MTFRFRLQLDERLFDVSEGGRRQGRSGSGWYPRIQTVESYKLQQTNKTCSILGISRHILTEKKQLIRSMCLSKQSLNNKRVS